jgi:hypothetical protein
MAVRVDESFGAAKFVVYAASVGPDGHGPYARDATYRKHALAMAKRRVVLAGARPAQRLLPHANDAAGFHQQCSD